MWSDHVTGSRHGSVKTRAPRVSSVEFAGFKLQSSQEENRDMMIQSFDQMVYVFMGSVC